MEMDSHYVAYMFFVLNHVSKLEKRPIYKQKILKVNESW